MSEFYRRSRNGLCDLEVLSLSSITFDDQISEDLITDKVILNQHPDIQPVNEANEGPTFINGSEIESLHTGEKSHNEEKNQKQVASTLYNLRDVRIKLTKINSIHANANKARRNKQMSAALIAEVQKSVELYCPRCSVTSESRRKQFKDSREKCNRCGDFLFYRCKNCKRQYSWFNSVYQHVRSETSGQIWYACDNCTFRSKLKYNLKTHIRRYHCLRTCSGCDLTFQTLKSLKEHQRERNFYCRSFKCKRCSFSCTNMSSLKQHVSKVHVARYTCFKCGTKCNNLKSFARHRNISCRERFFNCEHCKYKSVRKSHLASHLKTHLSA